MTKALKRYIYLFRKLEGNKLDDDQRNAYEEEIDKIYYELDDDDLEYVANNELEM